MSSTDLLLISFASGDGDEVVASSKVVAEVDEDTWGVTGLLSVVGVVPELV